MAVHKQPAVGFRNFLIYSAAVAAALLLAGNQAHAQTRAVRANDFLSSLGVNIHDDQIDNDSSYTPQILYLGIRNVRSGARRSAEQIPVHEATKVPGASPGVKFDLIIYGDGAESAGQSESGPNSPYFQGILADARKLNAAGALLSFDGPNEPNNQAFTYDGQKSSVAAGGTWLPVAKFQRDLYMAVKADPVLGRAGANIPVFDITEMGAEPDDVGLQFIVIPHGSGLSMPDGTRFADYANVHNYVSPTKNDNPWNGASPNEPGPSDGMAGEYFGTTWWHHYKALPLGSAPIPMVSTEFGWSTDRADTKSPITQEEQGALITDQFLDQYARGFRYSFVYQMRDNEGGNAGFGLFDRAGHPKLAGVYIHNLTAILADDSSSFTPGSVAFSIPDKPATVHALLLEKRDKTYYLAVWDEDYTGADHISVDFGAPRSRIAVYDPTMGTAPIQILRNVSAAPLTLTDHAVILRLSSPARIGK